jgi:hypothetical protein
VATAKQATPTTPDGDTPLTAWNLVAQLLSGEYADAGWTTAGGDGTAARPRAEWEALLVAMLQPGDRPPAATAAFVLALARLDPQVDAALRAGPLWRRLLRDLHVPLERIFRPWALPAPQSEFLELWTVPAEQAVRAAALSMDGSQLATGSDSGALVWDLGASAGVDLRASFAVRVLAADADGLFWTSFGGEGLTALPMGTLTPWHVEQVRSLAFSRDGRWLTTVTSDGVIRRSVANRQHQVTVAEGHAYQACAVSPDGSLVATVDDVGVTLWDPSGGVMLAQTGGVAPSSPCAFVAGGRLLAVPWTDGATLLLDVPTLVERGRLGEEGPTIVDYGASGDGHLLAVVHEDGSCRVWEEVEAPTSLPVVVADTAQGTDRLDVSADATALANVIAARSTSPPLSIGLFGDWGSGKSFLIAQVQKRIRTISRRARQTEGSPYCGYVRNIEFNAWHYADGNLWASLVTHLFEQLGSPDAEAGVPDAETARAQVRRLEEELADQSVVREELEQAQQRARQAEARKALLRWTWGLSGAGGDRSLEDVQKQAGTVRGALRLLLPNVWWRIAAAVVVAILAAAAVWLLVDSSALSLIPFGLLAALAGWGTVVAAKVRSLLRIVDRTAKVVDVQTTPVDAELDAARATEARLQQELEDLRTGRRLARFAAARGASSEYRSQLGLISKIHDDFERMSAILAEQAAAADGTPVAEADLPPVERIVLYIDDLDRCPPKRVVEVLEAVHLILAVPLFVVVVAVDPRWLVQSLRLHYSELLAVDGQEPGADDGHWQPTPVDYLEKIIQVPFALRPMRPRGVTALVQGLLPVDAGAAAEEAAAPDNGRPAGTPTDGATDDHEELADAAVATTGAVSRPPSLSPRTLALTRAERDAAVAVARLLRTPRTVKKLTNLYRLLRAGLDEPSGQLDRFLDRTDDVPQYEAVLLLLGLIIEVPDEASDVLRWLVGLPEEQEGARWEEFLDALPDGCAGARAFLVGYLPRMRDRWPAWTCGPFKAWALEVSRYSFATGQEVFAQAPVAAIQDDRLD